MNGAGLRLAIQIEMDNVYMYYNLKFGHIPYLKSKFSVIEFDQQHHLLSENSEQPVCARYNVLGPVMLPIRLGEQTVQFNWYLYFLDSEESRTKILNTLQEGKIDYDFFTKFSEAFTVNSVLSLGELEFNTRPDAVPLVRLHSCCATGDIFGSVRCDCGPQLDAALKAIVEEGYGGVVYLSGQEGRGIGLFAKALTYLLQECGHDTYEANSVLKLPEDARTFDDAGHILKFLYAGKSIRLLTNNPNKIAAMQRVGIEVAQRLELVVGVGPQNAGYLRAKAVRGHLFDIDQHQDQPDSADVTQI
jgi:GTP cyclohydrolase II